MDPNFNTAMSIAIRTVMPESCHRLCLWHIYQNAAKHLAQVYNKYPGFHSYFKKCVYEGGFVDDFEKRWARMINEYIL